MLRWPVRSASGLPSACPLPCLWILGMSVSIGVATAALRYGDPDTLIKRADRALYLAKNKGRNRIMTAQSLRQGPVLPPVERKTSGRLRTRCS